MALTATQEQSMRGALIGVRALIEADLESFFNSLDLSRPERARNALLSYIPTLVKQYGDRAAAIATDWYDEMRFLERVQGRFRAKTYDSPYLPVTTDAVRRISGVLFTDLPKDALKGLLATAPKYALGAGRETITRNADADPEASGWKRVTRGNGSCKFCRALAAKGGVYMADTVHFAAHPDCNCGAVPSWDPDAEPVPAAAYELSKRTSRMSDTQRAIHRHNTNAWLSYLT